MAANRHQQYLIGSRIRERRHERNLSLQELAGSAKISVSHLSRVERGLTLPSMAITVRIADGLSVSPEELTSMTAEEADRDARLTAALIQSGVDPEIAHDIRDSISAAARIALTDALSRSQ